MKLRSFRPCLPWAALLLLIMAIFAAVFALYQLPMEPLLYAGALSVMAGLIFLCLRLYALRRQHLLRRQVLGDPALLLEQLPPAEGLLQQDDRAIMEALLHQLRSTRTALDQSLQDNRDYFSAWVHQTKTPLSALRLQLQSEERDEQLLLHTLFQMEQYVDMALSYTRLCHPTKDLVLKEIPLDPIIRSVIRSFAPILIRKRITLHYAGCDALALSDERWLRFMLEQVMSNAAKYTDKGSITITVDVGPCIRITDTGMGIAPEDVPRVFEKGYTGYNGRSDQKATGLGLYLCRLTADMLGHRLSLHSRPGQGTDVCISLCRPALETE